jgi:hypothetical protein
VARREPTDDVAPAAAEALAALAATATDEATNKKLSTKKPSTKKVTIKKLSTKKAPERAASAGAGDRERLERIATLTAALGRSARTAGVGAVSSGRWLAETVVDAGGHIPVREAPILSARHDDLAGDDLADALIRTASRASASVGAAAGAVLAAQELVPVTWLTVPLELAIETALIAGLEMKLIGELQSAYGHPVAPAGTARAYSLARTWAGGRGVTPAQLVDGAPGMAEMLGLGARNELIRLVRRRLVRRAGVSLTALGPVLVGAAAGAAVNARTTRQFGETVRRTLRP